jgi:hypothetical protein
MNIIDQKSKNRNKMEFDKVSRKLYGIGKVVQKIKNEISTNINKFISTIEILRSDPNQSLLEKEKYDIQCQSFLNAISMYVGMKDIDGTPFINGVSDTSNETDILLELSFPNYTINKILMKLENISIDLTDWDITIGTCIINLIKSSQIAVGDSSYFQCNEFINSVKNEIEKLMVLQSHISHIEQIVNANLKYISELRSTII